MQSGALLVSYLAFAGHGQRLQTVPLQHQRGRGPLSINEAGQPTRHTKAEEALAPLQTLGALLLSASSAAFAPAGLRLPSALRLQSLSEQPSHLRGGLPRMCFGRKKRPIIPIDYSSLPGRSLSSWAREAGEYALKGMVPTVSEDGFTVATFAGGCFWGTELHFQRLEGVIATCVGYTQGLLEQPTYGQVKTQTTGHTEAVQIIYDPKVISYEDLCTKLLSTIDPSIQGAVGMDIGPQYRHGIYYHSEEQREAMNAAIEKWPGPVCTERAPAYLFWPAEHDHQRYLELGGRYGMCQSTEKGCFEPVRCYG